MDHNWLISQLIWPMYVYYNMHYNLQLPKFVQHISACVQYTYMDSYMYIARLNLHVLWVIVSHSQDCIFRFQVIQCMYVWLFLLQTELTGRPGTIHKTAISYESYDGLIPGVCGHTHLSMTSGLAVVG